MDVEPEEYKALDVEDENLYELEIKNLDTNEVMKMKIPIEEYHDSGSGKNSQYYDSYRKGPASGGIRFVRTFIKVFLTLGRCDWGERWESALLINESGEHECSQGSILQHPDYESSKQR